MVLGYISSLGLKINKILNPTFHVENSNSDATFFSLTCKIEEKKVASEFKFST